jgi:hypothetical protein
MLTLKQENCALYSTPDVQITLKTYAHFFVEDSFEAMEKLSQYVESETE